MKNYICNSSEYFFGNGYIALPVETSGLPGVLNINDKTLLLKSSFHISLVCVKNIVSKYGEDFEQKIIEFFCSFITKNKISFKNYKNEFRYAVDEKTGREAVIVMCDVLYLEEFFEVLSKEFGIETETPPTHITLYTLQQDRGIGLNNNSDIEEKTRIITEQVPVEIRDKFISR